MFVAARLFLWQRSVAPLVGDAYPQLANGFSNYAGQPQRDDDPLR